MSLGFVYLQVEREGCGEMSPILCDEKGISFGFSRATRAVQRGGFVDFGREGRRGWVLISFHCISSFVSSRVFIIIIMNFIIIILCVLLVPM